MFRAVHALSVTHLFSLDAKRRRPVRDQGHGRGTAEIAGNEPSRSTGLVSIGPRESAQI